MDRRVLSSKIKQQATELGFMSCGISKVEFLEGEAKPLELWLKNNRHGNMSYMENNFDMRLNPALILDGAKSVISVLLNYFPEKDLFKTKGLKISKYAYGKDYHFVIKDRLKELLKFIEKELGTVNARCFTDSAPIMDKAWAQRAGLGWLGKNGNLLNKKSGSFFFIGEIILDVELSYDGPVKDYCGSCTKCIDACPTDAIIKPYVVDGSKCISYLTIELKDELIPNKFENQMEGWVFGCDICQDVCPWNRFSLANEIDEFKPLIGLENIDLIDLTADSFNKIFKFSAIKRTKFTGLMRNVAFSKKNGTS
jgi:epoxyqueuosine reductase